MFDAKLMDSCSPPSCSAVPPPPQEAETEAKREERDKDIVHRTKMIDFLGRTTPIILQKDNGPCPLLAICNVLSLKNSLKLSPDNISEVSQEKLLSLIAEHLIDSNSNIDDKDTDYVENQQQNIADAIDLLPRLTTGIDVNIQFRRIDDFEFTPECAIFDLLDIPLYHGWIVDPQDSETADAIGSKSYNTLMGELVSLETQIMESEQKNDPEDDVDFVAATTAALGVPSPCLSRCQSFIDSPRKARKGDIEEVAELLRVLQLSAAERSSSAADGVGADVNLVENACIDKNVTSGTVTRLETVEKNVTHGTVNSGTWIPGEFTQEAVCSISKTDRENNSVHCAYKESTESCETAVDNISCDPLIENQNVQPVSLEEDSQSASTTFQDKCRSGEHVKNEFTSTSDLDEPRNHLTDCKAGESSSSIATNLDSSSGRVHNIDKSDTFTSSVDNSEPIYEGEECIMKSGTMVYENQEPIYEGEVALAEQVDRGFMDDGKFKGRISIKQGELIRNFMKNSASQLTIYGLFCLQDKVKEREICVFFRNNHFNTMFKVNGDTLFMTGNFKEFKMDDRSNDTWDEDNAMASTAISLGGYLGITYFDALFGSSDLELAIALQKLEFEEQQPQRNSQQQDNGSSDSRMITAPQVSQNSGKYVPSSSSKQESKSKEKCIVM
ncbi:hypothetical protein DH2020_049161 [Rehmannia glutinosa]|uniref:MINDY deubiquitinase domain-containing protein n=1 Tax=Rehmannia glutinosa TaxID=99300 RepID=A0ABR0U4J0_REHGL